jgi:hypothetical protein
VSGAPAQPSYSLTFGEDRVVLHGESIIGRGAGCQIMLNGPDVSRRHASLTPSDEGIVLADLGSFNGVYHNGQRIAGPTLLEDGDVITVGGFSLRFRNDAEGDFDLPDLLGDDDDDDADELTKRADRWMLLHSAGEALLDASQPERAERVLTPMLLGVLDQAGEPSVEPTHLDSVAKLALALARDTRRVRWINYVLDLYGEAEHPLPAARAAQVVQVTHELTAEHAAAATQVAERVARYLQLRRARDPGPDAAERATLSDLERALSSIPPRR